MKEIKLRAYDSVLKEWVYLTITKGSHEYRLPSRKSDSKNWSDWQMFTGLTGLFDKNGKEIWEGDIVKCTPNNWMEIVGVVEYVGAYYVVRAKGINHQIMNGMQSPLEVIGNILTTP